MAVRNRGKRTRFACLETTRFMVAITVSVITVAVVVNGDGDHRRPPPGGLQPVDSQRHGLITSVVVEGELDVAIAIAVAVAVAVVAVFVVVESC